MHPIRIFLIDDHTIVRAGLKALIHTQADLKVVGDCNRVQHAVHTITQLQPDVILLDLSLACGGAGAITTVRQACPKARVLVLTMHDDRSYLRASLMAGAAGYLVKHAADDALLTAIRTVHSGRAYVDGALADAGLKDVIHGGGPLIATQQHALEQLSHREHEVLELVAYGYTNREVAERLGVSTKSVETYRARVFDKLGLKTRADLVRFALDMGIVRPSPHALAHAEARASTTGA